MHGDVIALVNADRGLIDKFTTGPNGEAISTSLSENPNNTANGTTWGYLGTAQRLTESNSLKVTQMDARVYIPELGRFLQVDPIEGGVDNNYIYPTDPINKMDTDGKAQKGVQQSKMKILSIQELTALKNGKNAQNKKIYNSALQKQKYNQKMTGERASRASKDIKKIDVGKSVDKALGKSTLLFIFLGPLLKNYNGNQVMI